MKLIDQMTANDPALAVFLTHVASGFFSAQEEELLARLVADDQKHLFTSWDPLGTHDDLKRNFVTTLLRIDESYPTGLMGYIANARQLLHEAREGINLFSGFVPSRPDVVDLSTIDEHLGSDENIGYKHMGQLAVILVAGGLGERLGYSGIKINIAIESVTGMTYLAYYAACIKAMERKARATRPVPFIIMTSDQTHEKTVATLQEGKYFGLDPAQVHIITQKLVPALADNDAHLALDRPYQLVLKPHGHGDIHMLLHSSGLARNLYADGVQHLLFIQDTNAQVFNIALAALGSSIRHGFDFNSVAVKRIAGEAAGAIAKLTRGAESFTLNVEYNLLDPLLRATTCPDGDAPGPDGNSPFPGNINVLVMRLASYLPLLETTKGVIAEFVNPKYADPARSIFKTPTRLETMMQDLPKLYRSGERVGVTVFDRVYCFSANKNNLADARKKHVSGGPAESAITAESDFYHGFRLKLAYAGAKIASVPVRLVLGIPFVSSPRVFLDPSFALTLAEIKDKIHGLVLEEESTLYLSGPHVTLHNVSLARGASLMINASEMAHVSIRDITVTSPGHTLSFLNEDLLADPSIEENIRLRGYRMLADQPVVYNFPHAGNFIIDQNGVHRF